MKWYIHFFDNELAIKRCCRSIGRVYLILRSLTYFRIQTNGPGLPVTCISYGYNIVYNIIREGLESSLGSTGWFKSMTKAHLLAEINDWTHRDQGQKHRRATQPMPPLMLRCPREHVGPQRSNRLETNLTRSFHLAIQYPFDPISNQWIGHYRVFWLIDIDRSNDPSSTLCFYILLIRFVCRISLSSSIALLRRHCYILYVSVNKCYYIRLYRQGNCRKFPTLVTIQKYLF